MASLPSQASSRRAFLATTLCLGSAFAGCMIHFRPPVERPRVEMRTASFVPRPGADAVLRMEMSAYNPNSFDLQAREVAAALSVEGRRVANTRIAFSQVLPAGQMVPVVVDVAVPRAALARSGVSVAVAGSPNLNFEIEGLVDILSENGPTDVPFVLRGAVPAETLAAWIASP